MRSPEEILLSGRKRPVQEWTLFRKEDVLIAMQTYAEQQAVEFAEWVAPYNYYGKGIWVGFDDVQYTTSDLYKLFTQQKQK